MKINLQNIELAKSVLTDNVYIGLPEIDEKSWITKKNVTNQFIDAAIKRFGGYREVIHKKENNDDKYYKIKCVEISEEQAKKLKEE